MKIIKVDEKTHQNIRLGASNSCLSMKEFIKRISIRNINGIPFDVDAYSNIELQAVLLDIIDALSIRLNIDAMDLVDAVRNGFADADEILKEGVTL